MCLRDQVQYSIQEAPRKGFRNRIATGRVRKPKEQVRRGVRGQIRHPEEEVCGRMLGKEAALQRADRTEGEHTGVLPLPAA